MQRSSRLCSALEVPPLTAASGGWQEMIVEMELFRSRGEDPSSVGETLLHRIIGDPEVGHGLTEVTEVI